MKPVLEGGDIQMSLVLVVCQSCISFVSRYLETLRTQLLTKNLSKDTDNPAGRSHNINTIGSPGRIYSEFMGEGFQLGFKNPSYSFPFMSGHKLSLLVALGILSPPCKKIIQCWENILKTILNKKPNFGHFSSDLYGPGGKGQSRLFQLLWNLQLNWRLPRKRT